VYPGPIGAIPTPMLTGHNDPIPSLPYASPSCGPASRDRRVSASRWWKKLMADIGFRPIHLGETAGSLDAVDSLARLWFLLAIQEGYGRRLAVRFLTQADDPAS
jgi:hypothetical protein